MTMQTMTQQVGRKIMLIRTQQGILQSELAERAGLRQSHLSNMEKGNRNIDVEKLAAIARELHCKMADLLPEAEGGRPAA